MLTHQCLGGQGRGTYCIHGTRGEDCQFWTMEKGQPGELTIFPDQRTPSPLRSEEFLPYFRISGIWTKFRKKGRQNKLGQKPTGHMYIIGQELSPWSASDSVGFSRIQAHNILDEHEGVPEWKMACSARQPLKEGVDSVISYWRTNGCRWRLAPSLAHL